MHLRVFCSIILFLLPCFSASEKAPYPTFAKDATSAPPVSYYDYIVVGGGTSGCALAATLSEGANVLLLERGGLPYGNRNITEIGGFAATLSDVSPTSPSQLFVSTDGVVNHRARVLGGGSCLNAGFYTRASSEYMEKAGWDQRLVNESYEWVERKVAFEPPMLQWQSAVRDGLLQAGVLPYNGFTYDHIYGTKVGGTIFDRNGRRHTAADLLEYAHPRRITVYLNATVHQILFSVRGEAKRANGVTFEDGKGKKHTAYLSRGSAGNEVILSAGALGSPQLLMLSGIGPADHLRAHGIELVVDETMVGQGMSDNPMNAILVPSPQPVEVSLIQVVGITEFGSFIEASSGSFDLSWLRRTQEQYRALFNQTTGISFTWPTNQRSPETYAGAILEKIVGPLSTGHLELQTNDPKDNPRVTFNYFKEPVDLERCVQGMKTIIQVIESQPLSAFRFPLVPVQALLNGMLGLPVNLRPKHLEATFSLEQYCIDTVMTIWHYHGGCQVGKVVDRDYKVHGVESLRVVDGSTFEYSPGTNPQATVMMLGRYMGQKILQQRFGEGRR